jgi:hypothetical protein
VKLLRDAFTATMKDAAFLAEAERQKMPIEPMTGEEATAICDELYRAVKPELVTLARGAMQ